MGRLKILITWCILSAASALLLSMVACTYEENTEVSIDGENPPTFKLHGSGNQQYFSVAEVSPDNYVPPAQHDSDKDIALWKIVPIEQTPPRAWDYPPITYGSIPNKFRQELPQDGTPPPLVEGRLYEAGGPAYGANGGSVLFAIRNGKSVIVPKPKSQ